MLRELNLNQMEMVAGGTGDEVIVTGTYVPRTGPTYPSYESIFGFSGMTGMDVAAMSGLVEPRELIGDEASDFLSDLGDAAVEGDITITDVTTTTEVTVTIPDDSGTASICVQTPFGCIKVKEVPDK